MKIMKIMMNIMKSQFRLNFSIELKFSLDCDFVIFSVELKFSPNCDFIIFICHLYGPSYRPRNCSMYQCMSLINIKSNAGPQMDPLETPDFNTGWL